MSTTSTLAITSLDKRELRRSRHHMQMIFQDPYASLNPRMTVRDIISEPLIAGAGDWGRLTRKEVDARVLEIAMNAAACRRDQLKRFPHAFSGGQRQRIAIARALVLNPALVVCDEPISSLDVSIQAQILNLLADLQESLGLTYLFIAHDLAAVAYVCDRVAVMYLGRIVEVGTTRQVYFTPRHPYTEALMSAVPEPDPDAPRRPILLSGERPDPANPPSGCRFRTRCGYATALCAERVPRLRDWPTATWSPATMPTSSGCGARSILPLPAMHPPSDGPQHLSMTYGRAILQDDAVPPSEWALPQPLRWPLMPLAGLAFPA